MMDYSEYKRICAQPDVMRRPEIRATANLLADRDPALSGRVSSLLSAPSVPKPSGHRGGPESDYLFLDLEPDDLPAVVDALGDLEAALSEAGESASLISHVGDLLSRWNRADSSRPAA